MSLLRTDFSHAAARAPRTARSSLLPSVMVPPPTGIGSVGGGPSSYCVPGLTAAGSFGFIAWMAAATCSGVI